jgi:hypothetical protein
MRDMKFAPLAFLLVVACASPDTCDQEAAHITRNTQIGREDSFRVFRDICLANQQRRSVLGQIAQGAAEAQPIYYYRRSRGHPRR